MTHWILTFHLIGGDYFRVALKDDVVWPRRSIETILGDELYIVSLNSGKKIYYRTCQTCRIEAEQVED